MTKSDIIALLQKHVSGEMLTDEEMQRFNELSLNRKLTEEVLFELLNADDSLSNYDDTIWEPVLEKVFAIDKVPKATPGTGFIPPVRPLHFLRRWRWVAACLIGVFAVGGYFLATRKTGSKSEVPVLAQKDIQPGKEGAILTLADGSQVLLDTITDAVVALQGGAKASVKNGNLFYESNGSEVVYNTISTPNGRQYRITLPDGTNVWLNAASSIRFPTAFKTGDRQVEITGEVFFDVKRDAKKSFLIGVKEKDVKIEVLGTSFNVNAYHNEQVLNTTLIDGALRINGTTLRPGQQAQLSGSRLAIIENANIDKIISWKNGAFNFEGSGIGEVMRQLERWYGIEVDYKNAPAGFTFRGGMYRNVNLSDVLDMMKDMGVKFEWNGEVLTVLP